MILGPNIQTNFDSLYEEVSHYWKFAYPAEVFPASMSQLLSTNLRHPLLDISWIHYQLNLFKLLDQKPGVFPAKVSISLSMFFDSVWYANMLYDAGILFPDSLYSDWLMRGFPNGVTVLTSGSSNLPVGNHKKNIEEIFHENTNVEKIWSKLGSNQDTFLVDSSWEVSV